MQDEYRSMQDGLLAWLRAIEREKLALNLRHVRVGSGGVERALKKVEASNRKATRNMYKIHRHSYLHSNFKPKSGHE